MKKVKHNEYTEDIGNIKDNEVARCNNRLNNSKDQNNQYTVIEDMKNGVINIINFIDSIFTKV